MSYILNALKKAERDRLREEPQDLDDFVSSGWDPYQATEHGPWRSAARYGLPVGIVLIAAGLFYWFSILNSAPAPQSAIAIESSKLSPVSLDEMAQPPANLVSNAFNSPEPIDSPEPKNSPEQLSSPEPQAKNLPASASPQPIIELPTVTITGHIYIRSGSRLNRIFVGDKTYHAGDNLDRNWVIESINSDSLVLRAGTKTTQLPLR